MKTDIDLLFSEIINTSSFDISRNDFYSTQIFSVYPVAKHIVKLDIDERLKAGTVWSISIDERLQLIGSQFAARYALLKLEAVKKC